SHSLDVGAGGQGTGGLIVVQEFISPVGIGPALSGGVTEGNALIIQVNCAKAFRAAGIGEPEIGHVRETRRIFTNANGQVTTAGITGVTSGEVNIVHRFSRPGNLAGGGCFVVAIDLAAAIEGLILENLRG